MLRLRYLEVIDQICIRYCNGSLEWIGRINVPISEECYCHACQSAIVFDQYIHNAYIIPSIEREDPLSSSTSMQQLCEWSRSIDYFRRNQGDKRFVLKGRITVGDHTVIHSHWASQQLIWVRVARPPLSPVDYSQYTLPLQDKEITTAINTHFYIGTWFIDQQLISIFKR